MGGNSEGQPLHAPDPLFWERAVCSVGWSPVIRPLDPTSLPCAHGSALSGAEMWGQDEGPPVLVAGEPPQSLHHSGSSQEVGTTRGLEEGVFKEGR